jgi:ABC-type transport system involved in multi-copper enzyme maturation permease subunit
MIKLIKLELQKMNILKHVRNVFITATILGLLLFMLIFIDEGKIKINEALEIIGTMVNVVFAIYAAVLIGRLIVSEYKYKTIYLLFSYPVNRKKIFIVKFAIVSILTFLNIILTSMILLSGIMITDNFVDILSGTITSSIFLYASFKFLANAVMYMGISLIPVFFGIRKNSVSKTIVSAFIINLFLAGNISFGEDFQVSLYNFIIIPIFLCFTGIFIAYSSIKNVEKLDLDI